MKKICFVTTARSDYGLLKWIMKDVQASGSFELQIIAAWGHLCEEQGKTADEIIADGFHIDAYADARADLSSEKTIAASLGRLFEVVSDAYDKCKPDYVAVLGDRYELLPLCSAAFVMHIPIIHISGGDVTEGAIDNGVRNAVTMLSSYHFPGTGESARNIIRMRGNDENVYAVGEPGLDAFYREQLSSRDELAKDLKIDAEKRWILLTYHPETTKDLEYNLAAVNNLLRALSETEDVSVIMTYANADEGGDRINVRLEEQAKAYPDRFKVFKSLGQKRYLGVMKQVACVVGNSSSGIVEAPVVGCPVVNVGDRQKGRHLCANIIQCDEKYESIKKAISSALSEDKNLSIQESGDDHFWGDGHTSERIVGILKDIL